MRKVHAIRIILHSGHECSVIVWLNDTAKLCIELLNNRKTWETAQAGDSVWLTSKDEKTRYGIEAIELYRAFPASENGREVRSVWDWLRQGG